MGAFIIGALMFIACYGIRVLDVTYDDWIFHSWDPDIKQHYLGWCFYRRSPFRFPYGLMEGLGYPAKMSILWTDSVPLLAMLFKPFSPLLPKVFQYLGWYGLLSTALSSALGAVIVNRLAKNSFISYISAVCFAIMPHMLQRMFYHTTLTAQWLILLPLLLWIKDFYRLDIRHKCLIWASYSFMAVTIHPYLWAMGCFIWAFAAVEEIIITKKLLPSVITAVSMVASAVLGLWIMGAFYGGVNSTYIASGYESNLNTFINPLGKSRFLKDLPLAIGLQYEGYGYLGAGMLLLCLVSAVVLIIRLIRKKKIISLRLSIFALMGLFFMGFAAFPEVSLNDKILVTLPQPGIIGTFFGTFRSTGRFIWPLVWLLTIGAIVCTAKYFKENIAVLIICFCAFLQIFDLSYAIADKKNSLVTEKKAHSDLDSLEDSGHIKDYKHIVMTYDDNIDMNDLAYFAYKNNLTINRYYFARDINEEINENLEEYRKKLIQGQIPKDCIFVMKEKNLPDWSIFDLHFYYLDGSYIGVADPIDGLEEAT